MSMDLKDCPFCGGIAEMDTQRAYRPMVSGKAIGTGIAIYCLSCDAEMMRCREDTPDVTPDEMAEAWNRRAPAADAIREGRDTLIATLRADLAAVTAERDRAVAELNTVTSDLVGLVENSGGVFGLHLNGDLSPWPELLRGGQFEEWLADAFDVAKARDTARSTLQPGQETTPNAG
jgi:hypothetical protein